MNISRLLRLALFAALAATPALLSAQDDDLASLRAKAEKGNAVAQYNLGLAYAEGRGTAVDPIEAYVWLSLAKDNGARGLALNNLAATLDAATINTAKQRLATRQAAPSTLPTPAANVATPVPAANEASSTQQTVADKKQLSTELADAWREIETLKADVARAKENSPAVEQLRTQRDTLSTKLSDLVATVAALRAEREKTQQTVAGLERDLEGSKSELERAKSSITALQQAPKPTIDNSAAESKVREMRSALTDLATARDALQQLSASRAKLAEEKESLENMLNSAQNAALESGKQADALKTQVAELTANATTPAVPTALTAPAYADLSGRVSELEAQLAAATQKTSAPSYPDLSGRVAELEAAAAAPRTPAYPDLSAQVNELQLALEAVQEPVAPDHPDLSDRVKELEVSLAAAQGALRDEQAKVASVTPAPSAPAPSADEPGEPTKELAEIQMKLEVALRAFTLLENERDELAARAAKSGEILSADRDSLSVRLSNTESKADSAQAEVARLDAALTALQRSTSQASRDYAAQQVLLSQMRGANAVLAQENYQLKTALARDPNAARNSSVVPVTVSTPAAEAKTYTVVAGDSLSKISQRVYGNPQRWREIYQANLDRLSGENSLKVGLQLRIP